MRNVKNHISLFYVSLILVFKVLGLHSLSHQTDDVDAQHCEVCHIASVVNFIPLLETETLDALQPEYYFLEQPITITSIAVVNNRHLSSYLLTRPPPPFL